MSQMKDPHPCRKKQKKTLDSFLKDCLENERISGLSWMDKNKGIWKLPWKIHRLTVWGEPDATVLHAWAVYKYDYKGEEPLREELKKWKEKLRNAIIASPCIKELPDCHEQKIPYPYKVYQFIAPKPKNTELNNNTQKHEDNLQDSQFFSCVETFNVPNFNVLSPLSDLHPLVAEKDSPSSSTSCSSRPHDDDVSTLSMHSYHDTEEILTDLSLTEIEQAFNELSKENINFPNHGQMFGPKATNFSQIPDTFNFTHKNNEFCPQSREREGCHFTISDFRSRSPIGHKENHSNGPMRFDCQKRSPDGFGNFRDINFDVSQDVSSEQSDETQNESLIYTSPFLPLDVSVSYISHKVISDLKQDKFKLCYVESDGMRGSILQCPTPAQFGPSDAFLVELPHSSSIQSLNSEKAEIISTVLTKMKRGITVSYSGGDIFATRYCKAIAYYKTQNGHQAKLERDETTKIFDFNEYFQSHFKSDQWASLTPYVKINFGVKSSSVEVVTITITHREAQRMLQERENHDLLVYTEPDCSISNEFDTRLSIEQKLRNVQV
ncbi:hypothetical protein EGW08_008515 [Elysia chlorotica]|uniref:IRF tryptophan pentad repeat domain-containing protein n=1 Tax=Elysia chlorotica TaxID=188477 RepID=A0A3S1BLN1_ELYCH|nr:hypothetical protein EGW08_008515 [Elysia chlorotica]